MTLLLDTCALVFIVGAPDRLTEVARQAVSDPDNTVFVSAVSAGELACATERRRVELDRPWADWFQHHVQANARTVLPITVETMIEAYSLPTPFHNDPADRLMVAHARLGQHTIVTTDGRIRKYAHVASLE